MLKVENVSYGATTRFGWFGTKQYGVVKMSSDNLEDDIMSIVNQAGFSYRLRVEQRTDVEIPREIRKLAWGLELVYEPDRNHASILAYKTGENSPLVRFLNSAHIMGLIDDTGYVENLEELTGLFKLKPTKDLGL